MSGSLNRSGGENVAGISGTCATYIITYLARGPCFSTVRVYLYPAGLLHLHWENSCASELTWIDIGWWAIDSFNILWTDHINAISWDILHSSTNSRICFQFLYQKTVMADIFVLMKMAFMIYADINTRCVFCLFHITMAFLINMSLTVGCDWLLLSVGRSLSLLDLSHQLSKTKGKLIACYQQTIAMI